MNPSIIGRVLANDKERMLRIFSRFVFIPYKKLQTKEGSLKKSLALQAAMKEVMAQVIRSVGVILQLRDDFTGRQEDELFNEHIQQEENATSDVQFNGNGNKDLMIEVIEEVLTKVTEDPQS
ncbi:Hypothetical predicted protein, partial [Paramuricea clavata]